MSNTNHYGVYQMSQNKKGTNNITCRLQTDKLKCLSGSIQHETSEVLSQVANRMGWRARFKELYRERTFWSNTSLIDLVIGVNIKITPA